MKDFFTIFRGCKKSFFHFFFFLSDEKMRKIVMKKENIFEKGPSQKYVVKLAGAGITQKLDKIHTILDSFPHTNAPSPFYSLSFSPSLIFSLQKIVLFPSLSPPSPSLRYQFFSPYPIFKTIYFTPTLPFIIISLFFPSHTLYLFILSSVYLSISRFALSPLPHSLL